MGNINSSEGQEEWIRIVIAQLSPSIGKYGAKVLIDEIEPLVQKILSRSTKDENGDEILVADDSVSRREKFKFEKTDLGSTPPKITNIRAHQGSHGVHVDEIESQGSQIILDFDIDYVGDCDLQVSIMGIRGGVRDVRLCGRARLVLKPTMSELPFVGGIQICFLDEPMIGFDMEGLANIADWPGLRRKVRKEIIEDMSKRVVFPNRLSLPLSSRADLQLVKGFAPKGVLFVKILACKDLPSKGGVRKMFGQGKPDCYVRVRMGSTIYYTTVIKNTCEPVWDDDSQWYEFPLETLRGHNLNLAVFDHDSMSRDEFMGKVEIEAMDVNLDEDAQLMTLLGDEEEKSKYDEVTGQICMTSKWLQLVTCDQENPPSFEPKLDGQKTVAIFSVFVYNCNNLTDPQAEPPTSRVILSLDAEVYQSDWEKKRNHPVFGFGKIFKLQNFGQENQIVKIEIQGDTGGNFGEIELPIQDFVENPIDRKLFQLSQPQQTIEISAKLSFFM